MYICIYIILILESARLNAGFFVNVCSLYVMFVMCGVSMYCVVLCVGDM